MENKIKKQNLDNYHLELCNLMDLKGISIYKLSVLSKMDYTKIYDYIVNKNNQLTLLDYIHLWNSILDYQ